VTDGDAALAARHAEELARAFWEQRREYDEPVLPVAEAVVRGRKIEGGPVLLLNTPDTTGGGAAGDSIALVKGLLEASVTEPTLAMVVDPEAAAECHRRKVGDTLTLRVGHKIDRRWGSSLELTAELVRLTDGRFRYTGGVFGGIEACMGPSAVLRVGSIQLLVMSRPTYDWAYEQYASAGLDPRAAKFVEVKNMMNFRQGYRDIAKGWFALALPGPTPIDYRALPFQRVKRPIYPLDEMAEEPVIELVRSRAKPQALPGTLAASRDLKLSNS
jgi:microcystin degradation protein MlrC